MVENRPLLRSDLARMARERGVPPEVIEKDYALSYLLAGLAAVGELDGLCFKGGTALKKIYFGDYRLPFQIRVPLAASADGAGEGRSHVR